MFKVFESVGHTPLVSADSAAYAMHTRETLGTRITSSEQLSQLYAGNFLHQLNSTLSAVADSQPGKDSTVSIVFSCADNTVVLLGRGHSFAQTRRQRLGWSPSTKLSIDTLWYHVQSIFISSGQITRFKRILELDKNKYESLLRFKFSMAFTTIKTEGVSLMALSALPDASPVTSAQVLNILDTLIDFWSEVFTPSFQLLRTRFFEPLRLHIAFRLHPQVLHDVIARALHGLFVPTRLDGDLGYHLVLEQWLESWEPIPNSPFYNECFVTENSFQSARLSKLESASRPQGTQQRDGPGGSTRGGRGNRGGRTGPNSRRSLGTARTPAIDWSPLQNVCTSVFKKIACPRIASGNQCFTYVKGEKTLLSHADHFNALPKAKQEELRSAYARIISDVSSSKV